MKDDLEVTLIQCSVCKKIKIDNLWSDNLPEFYSGKRVIYSHGVCSPLCTSKGYGLSIDEANDIFYLN